MSNLSSIFNRVTSLVGALATTITKQSFAHDRGTGAIPAGGKGRSDPRYLRNELRDSVEGRRS